MTTHKINFTVRDLDPIINQELNYLAEQKKMSKNTLVKHILTNEIKKNMFQSELNELKSMEASIRFLSENLNEFTLLVTSLLELYHVERKEF